MALVAFWLISAGLVKRSDGCGIAADLNLSQ
jgi:hypothetical protein